MLCEFFCRHSSRYGQRCLVGDLGCGVQWWLDFFSVALPPSEASSLFHMSNDTVVAQLASSVSICIPIKALVLGLHEPSVALTFITEYVSPDSRQSSDQ